RLDVDLAGAPDGERPLQRSSPSGLGRAGAALPHFGTSNVPQLTTAGRLLTQLSRDSIPLQDLVITAAGIAADAARTTAAGDTRLSLAEQLRLAEATIAHAPAHARQATRLRAQALAAQ